MKCSERLYFCGAFYSSSAFKPFSSCVPHDIPVRLVIVLSILLLRSLVTEKLNNLPQIIWLISGSVKISTQRTITKYCRKDNLKIGIGGAKRVCGILSRPTRKVPLRR